MLKNCTTNFDASLCGVNVVIDPQLVGATETAEDRVLIIGQKSDDGTAGIGFNKVIEATRSDLFGVDSMLNRQIEEFQDVSTAEVWAYVLPNTGTAGEASVTIEGVDSASASGVIYLWINGVTYSVNFDPNQDTNDSIASKLQATISATDSSLLVTSTANTINIETLIKGKVGGFLDVRSKYGRRPDQLTSNEITVSISTTASTGHPDLSAIASETEGFEFVINPYTDDGSVDSLAAYLCGQWSGGVNSRGYGIFYGSAEDAKALGERTNNALISYMTINGALTPSYLESSWYGGIIYNQLNRSSDEISMSLSGKIMAALLAPEQADVYSRTEKASLIESGIGYFDIDRDNRVKIGHAVTTYTVADNGLIDMSLNDVNKPAMLAYVSTYTREKFTEKYSGYSFREDGVVGSNSKKVATIKALENYMISIAGDLSNKNIVQDVVGFAKNLSVTRNEEGCVIIDGKPKLVEQLCCLTINLNTY